MQSKDEERDKKKEKLAIIIEKQEEYIKKVKSDADELIDNLV